MPYEKNPFGVWHKKTVALETVVAPAEPTSTSSRPAGPLRQATLFEMKARAAPTPAPQEATPSVVAIEKEVIIPSPRLTRSLFGFWEPNIVIGRDILIAHPLVDEDVATPPPKPLVEMTFEASSVAAAQATSQPGKTPSSGPAKLKGLRFSRSGPIQAKHTTTINGNQITTQVNA